MSPTLAENFGRFFKVVFADDEHQVRAAQMLRYQVYCVETNFEDASQHSAGLESDNYDSRSIHSIIKYLQREGMKQNVGEAIATVRLILPRKDGLEGDFPIERYSVIDPARREEIEKRYHRSEIAETSRFCVSKDFRQRFKESETIHGIVEPPPTEDVLAERRAIPHISLGLIQAAVDMSRRQSIRLWYALMEPQLVRLLKRFGLHYIQIGEPVNYHGIRVPCMAVLDETLHRMKADCPEIWAFITRDGTLWPY